MDSLEMPSARAVTAAFIMLIQASSAAAGQSLRDLRAQESENKALAREAAYTSEVCGRPIPASIDWSRSKDWPAHESLTEACDGALGAVETICRAGKKTAVRSFVCSGDSAGPSLSGGVLRYGAAPGVNGYAATLATIGAAE